MSGLPASLRIDCGIARKFLEIKTFFSSDLVTTGFACLECGHRFAVGGQKKMGVCPNCGSPNCIQLLGGTAPAGGDGPGSGRVVDASAPPGANPLPETGLRGMPTWMQMCAGLALLAVVLGVLWMLGAGLSSPSVEPSAVVKKETASTPPLDRPPSPVEMSSPAAIDPPIESAPASTVPAVKNPPAEAATSTTHVAASLSEVEKAVVKFELPSELGNLMQSGTGFVINDRGWVATNHHLIARITKDARVKLADGTRLELAGIVARDPKRDLAIVRIANPRPHLGVLDIACDKTPPLGDQVFAFGHPYNADFSLSKGIVSRVLTTKDLLDSQARHLVARLGAPAEMVWIQHDAKISPGSSGGPLMDERGRVLGINTFVHLKAEFGYASHIRYLRQLAASATGAMEPLPEAKEPLKTVVSTAKMKQLFSDCAAFGWKPSTPEQYQSMADLAGQMTLARHVAAIGKRSTERMQQSLANVAKAANETFAAIGKVKWSGENFARINQFATDQVDQVGEGIVLTCVVLGTDQQQGAVLMEIEGTGTPILVRAGGQVSTFAPKSRWFLFGFVTPEIARVHLSDGPEPRPARIVLTHFMVALR